MTCLRDLIPYNGNRKNLKSDYRADGTPRPSHARVLLRKGQVARVPRFLELEATHVYGLARAFSARMELQASRQRIQSMMLDIARVARDLQEVI